MSLMEKFSNPELFTSLGFGEKMAGSAITMLMGMGITFCVLLLLWGFVALMGKAMNMSNKEDKAPAQAAAAATPSAAAAPIAQVSSTSAETDNALVAVIAAAIAAYEGNPAGGNLVVKKIRRVSGDFTPWSNAAKEDCIESRKF